MTTEDGMMSKSADQTVGQSVDQTKGAGAELSVPLWKPEDGTEPDHSRENCPLPRLCAWHRPMLHLVVCSQQHGSRYLDLDGPEEMCAWCRVQNGSQISHQALATDVEPAMMVEAETAPRRGIGAYELILERIELLAERWTDESRRCKEWYDQYTELPANGSFRRSCWQRYVDYERRATELRNTVKYLPTVEEWQAEKRKNG